MDAELIVDEPCPTAPAVSPDGRWVVYRQAPRGYRGEHPIAELWLGAADGGAQPRRLDARPGELESPRWAPDSAAVFFRSDHATPGTHQLHRIRLDGGPDETLTSWTAGILDHQPLHGGLVAFTAFDEPTDEDRRRAEERDDAEVRSHLAPPRLRLLDLPTGRIGTPADFGGRCVAEFVERPGGGPLAVLTWPSPEPDPGLLEPALHLLDPETGQVEDLGSLPPVAESPVWWHDGDWRLACLAPTPPGLVAGNAVFAVTGENLTAGLPACPVELVQTAGAPLVLVADGLDTAFHRLGPAGLTELSRVRGLVNQLTASPDGAVVAAVVSTDGEPAGLYTGPPSGPLTHRSGGETLRAIRWGTQERLSYRAPDGLSLDGLLVLPPGRTRADGPFPLVTIPHGGPYARHADQLALHWVPSGQWLAHAGFAVFLPNPRGSQGHGHEFAAAVAGAVGQEEWLDVTTGIDLLIADGIADPARLGIAGWSHGGFVSAWAVAQTGRFRAAVMGAGICDWGMQAAIGELGRLEAALGGSVGWEGPGPHPHDRLSPVSYAADIRTPVLILHGAEDTNVPLAQAEYFHHALRRFGVAHEYVVYPREGHSFRERNHQLDVLRRTREWFDRHLR